MVSLDKAVVARYELHGHRFEILVDPDAALRVREAKEKAQVDVNKDLAIDTIFKDARKGDAAGETTVKETFGTTDVAEVAKRILLKGEFHLTTDQRRVLQDKKHKQIVALLARNAMNPQTKAPHPPTRIETAMAEAKVHVDPFKSAEEQLQTVLAALRPLLPIRIDNVSIAVHLPATEVGKAYGFVKGFGLLKSEEWQKDGSWMGVVEMPAGMQTEFFDELNRKTHGNVETRLIK
ncbi:MAG TPA: ribosome assembly factor SBDS [Candidatus Thermoplasmatota archaeon]|nr:ribosome assembly factor SBDS [Candidatus Thermoplasmatota archaeon]